MKPERPDIAAELVRRRDADQAARLRRPLDLDEVLTVDRNNTEYLQQIITSHGWPGFRLVGVEAASAAWLLAQHADRAPAFQHQALTLLAAAVQAGDASPKDLAYLTDRCRRAQKQPQVYGTQFEETPEGPRPQPIEDPDAVDERRREVGLEPLAEYAAWLLAQWADP